MSDRRPSNLCCETSAHASDCPNNPNSLGFDEPGLWMVDEWIAEGVVGAMHKPSDADLIAAVRRGVESGTIKGLPLFCVAHWCALTPGETTCSLYQRVEGMDACSVEARILICPVSDGGSET